MLQRRPLLLLLLLLLLSKLTVFGSHMVKVAKTDQELCIALILGRPANFWWQEMQSSLVQSRITYIWCWPWVLTSVFQGCSHLFWNRVGPEIKKAVRLSHFSIFLGLPWDFNSKGTQILKNWRGRYPTFDTFVISDNDVQIFWVFLDLLPPPCPNLIYRPSITKFRISWTPPLPPP